MRLFKKRDKRTSEEKIADEISKNMKSYATKEEVEEVLRKINDDAEKKRIWNSLTNYQKLIILRKVKRQRGK